MAMASSSTSAADFWGPSLLVLGSSVGLLGCRLPGASLDTASELQAEGQGPPAVVRERPGKKPRAGFAVVDAVLDGDGVTVRLEFTRPVGPTTGVDPNDFRLSFGMAYAYKMYAYAYYYDVGYTGDAGELAEFVGLEAEGEVVELRLADAFPLAYCAELEREVVMMQQEPGVRVKGGVFLHYSPGATALTDTKGKALGPAAEQWVLHRRSGGKDDELGELYIEGPKARRAFNGAIPVRCGPELPPGPR